MPSNLVKKITEDLIEHGVVQRAWLGVSILNLNAKRAESLGLTEIKGVFVDLVERGGAAKEAGLEYEDVITKIDGIPTTTKPEFLEVIARYRPGDKIDIEYLREGKSRKATAVLRNQLNTTDYIAVSKDKVFTDLGFELRNLDNEEQDRNQKDGVMVVSIQKDSKIASVNMEPGYIITSVNGQSITSIKELKTILESDASTFYLNGFYENYPMEWPYKFSK